jgi:hypothetical protein
MFPAAVCALLLLHPAVSQAATTRPATGPATQSARKPAKKPASVTISGTLAGRAGWSVLAISPRGPAKGARLTKAGAFKLTLPAADAKDATLQLVNSAGRYAGPVVLAVSKGKAHTALGGKTVVLGALTLRTGYARVTRKLPAGTVDVARWARADAAGKPDGAGRLGLVRAKKTGRASLHEFLATSTPDGRLAATAASGSGSGPGSGDDPDRDGVPSLFDADDNGNGTLDIVDPVSARSPGSNAGLFSTLYASFTSALNVNAGGVTQAQIDALISGENTFNTIFYFDSGYVRGATVNSVDVDCYAVRYCARGTGSAVIGGLSESAPSLPVGTPWVDYSPNGSGLPNLENIRTGTWAMSVQPRVTTTQIHPGDAFAVNFRTSGGVVTVPTSLSAYFVTTPAISRWTNGTDTVDVTYPVADGQTGVLDVPGGQLGLNLWRPQRASIPGSGETGAFVDMGRLHYGLTVSMPGTEVGCGGYYSGLSGGLRNDYPAGGSSDPALRLFPLTDTATDAAPNPARQLGLTVDLAGCLAAAGVTVTPGQTGQVSLHATSEGRPGGMDRAAQSFSVRF